MIDSIQRRGLVQPEIGIDGDESSSMCRRVTRMCSTSTRFVSNTQLIAALPAGGDCSVAPTRVTVTGSLDPDALACAPRRCGGLIVTSAMRTSKAGYTHRLCPARAFEIPIRLLAGLSRRS